MIIQLTRCTINIQEGKSLKGDRQTFAYLACIFIYLIRINIYYTHILHTNLK